MKFRKFGRIALALAVSLATGFGVTSCSTDNTVGYLFVTATQYGQISAFRIDHNLGILTPAQNSPYPSGGVNPIRAVVGSGGKFVYVLNAGCGGTSQIACPPNTPPGEEGANISLFTVGGGGSLTYQTAYTSQGNSPISLLTNSTGSFLFVLDSLAPNTANCTAYVSTTPASACGDITAFSADPNTGRLSVILNQQVKNAAGTNLSYFPIGSRPIEFASFGSTSPFIYTIENGSGTAADPSQAVYVYQLNTTTGQLTLTQNTPIPSNAAQLSYIYASSTYVYLIDTGQGAGTTPAASAGQILPYTVGTNGALQSVVGGVINNTGTTANPGPMIVDHSGKFVYLANQGPNLTFTSSGSSVSAFFIVSGTTGAGQLQPIASPVIFGSGSSPRCILEDPSNQFLYTANYATSTVTGAVINIQAGTLTALRKTESFPTAGQPTWCVASGTLF
jgi:6-phosphogluconolactonase